MSHRDRAVLGLLAVSPVCPSYREIARAIGVSPYTVAASIRRLEKAGHITHTKAAHRDLQVVSL